MQEEDPGLGLTHRLLELFTQLPLFTSTIFHGILGLQSCDFTSELT